MLSKTLIEEKIGDFWVDAEDARQFICLFFTQIFRKFQKQWSEKVGSQLLAIHFNVTFCNTCVHKQVLLLVQQLLQWAKHPFSKYTRNKAN